MQNFQFAMMTTATEGAIALTLAAMTGFPTINAMVGGLNSYCGYVIENPATGGPLACGKGYLSATLTLERDANESVYDPSTDTWTEIGTTLALAAGTKRVFLHPMPYDFAATIPAVQSAFGIKRIAPAGLTPISGNSVFIAANTPTWAILEWKGGRPITGLSCWIRTAGGTGSDRLQLGVYALKANGQLGNLLGRTTDIAPNTTGEKNGTLSAGAIRPRGYLGFLLCSSVSIYVDGYNNSPTCEPGAMGMETGSMVDRIGFLSGAAVTAGWAALPSAGPAITGYTKLSSNFPPMVLPIVS
ncbi:hypothetical protein ACFJGW_00500 [Burkholderiaceae bacterium UC74_6]